MSKTLFSNLDRKMQKKNTKKFDLKLTQPRNSNLNPKTCDNSGLWGYSTLILCHFFFEEVARWVFLGVLRMCCDFCCLRRFL